MRKFNFLFIMLLILASLFTACSSGDSSDDEKDKNVLKIGDKFTIEDYAEITVKEVIVSPKVEPPKITEYSLTYGSDDEAKTYVTTVLELKNLSSEEIALEDFAEVAIKNGNAKFVCGLFLLLTEDDTLFSEYESIASDATSTIYCSTLINKDSLGDSVISFTVKDETYTMNINTADTTVKNKDISLDQTITAEDYAEFTLKSIELTDDVAPSKAKKSSSHIEIENTDNIYIDVIAEVTNFQSSDTAAELFYGAKAIYEGEDSYNGFIVAEEEDGTTFDRYLSIPSSSTTLIHSLIEVPKEVMTGNTEVIIYFNGERYAISLVDGQIAPTETTEPSEESETTED